MAVSSSDTHGAIFLPFLRMKSGHHVAGVDFLPLRDGSHKVPAVLASARAPLDIILSGYIDRHGKPFDNCVVATLPSRGWDLSRDEFSTAKWAASVLFLASWACNDYYPRFSGNYVNSSHFRVMGQGFTGAKPGYLAVVTRRRDGTETDAGYMHGEFKFSLPPQCSVRDPVAIDVPLLAALDKANEAGSSVIDRLRTALPFVELANTDDELMTEHAEAILMGSAFEQLLEGDASAYTLASNFGELFRQFGRVTVADAMRPRPGIAIDNQDEGRSAAQRAWWVHQKWMQELYKVRNKVVHEGDHAGRQWGWAVAEHLVMAAHVFPLTVKLLLERDGSYSLTEDDRVRCLAIDPLLAATQWVDNRDLGDESTKSWQRILSEARNELVAEKMTEAIRNAIRKHSGGQTE